MGAQKMTAERPLVVSELSPVAGEGLGQAPARHEREARIRNLAKNLERQHGRSLKEVLEEIYWGQRKSIPEAAKMLGVKEYTLGLLLDHAEIPRRTPAEFLSSAWANPRTRQDFVTKLQTLEIRRKRSEALKRFYQEHPQKSKAISKKFEEQDRELREMILGKNPGRALRRLVQKGWPDHRIAKVLSAKKGMTVGEGRITQWRRRFAIEPSYQKAARISEEARKLVIEAQADGCWQELRPRERFLLEKRYLSSGQPPTQKALAPILGVTTRARVQQLEKKALKRLRQITSGEPKPSEPKTLD